MSIKKEYIMRYEIVYMLCDGERGIVEIEIRNTSEVNAALKQAVRTITVKNKGPLTAIVYCSGEEDIDTYSIPILRMTDSGAFIDILPIDVFDIDEYE